MSNDAIKRRLLELGNVLNKHFIQHPAKSRTLHLMFNPWIGPVIVRFVIHYVRI